MKRQEQAGSYRWLSLAMLLLLPAAGPLAAQEAGSKPAATSASSGVNAAGKGYFRSDRTLEDIKEAEAALKEQRQKEVQSSPVASKSGTYTDPNGFAFRYGLTPPTKVESGVKYPVFIGNTGWALSMPSSQAQYPCYVLNVYMPETLFKQKPVTGYDAPKDYKTVYAAAIKAVVDKLLAAESGMDASRVSIEGASKFGAVALISAYNYPETYAAVVPSVGGCDISKALAIGQRKIGVWLFYGVLDGGEVDFKKTPHGRGGPHIYKAMTDAGYDAQITIYTHGDHHEYGFSDSLTNPDWNDFTRLRKWLFAQKKPTPTWPIIDSPSAVAAGVGKPFTYKITADKGPKSFGAALTIEHAEAADGTIAKPQENLPKGLTFDSKTGVISGSPREAGRFFIRLTASNDKGDGITTLQLTVKE